jgi:CheY-like chemotaxis protein
MRGDVSVSILVVDDEPDVAELFRQRFRREARDGTYVMHFANSGEGALEQLTVDLSRFSGEALGHSPAVFSN